MQMLFLSYKYQIFIGNPLTDIHADDTDTMKWFSYAYKVKMLIQNLKKTKFSLCPRN